jgi:hypothetical protein
MAKREPKDDLQIAAILDQHLKFTTGYQDSKLSKERTRVLEHYDGELPRPTSRGNSKYVSQDVFESVEALKATVLEVFSTNKEIVSFTPSGPTMSSCLGSPQSIAPSSSSVRTTAWTY